MKVALIIPTFNGKSDLERLLKSLLTQTCEFDLYIIDSGSKDGTLDLARAYSNKVISIKTSEFNHGGTRQLMVRNNPGYEVYVFMTQDAFLVDSKAIECIVAPFSDMHVGAVCGRQLPHFDANLLAQHARRFNYPEEQRIKTLEDAPLMGLKAAFMSNSFAAYRASALNNIGGFPDNVIFGEDMYAAAKMLLAGWKVAYAGDAQCYHSHNYTLSEEFRRYFDMGVFHTQESWIRESFGGAGGEGLRYVKSELKFLGLGHLYLWPLSLLRNAIKLIGYKLGQQEHLLPAALKRKCGMHKRYWDGPYALARSLSKQDLRK